jgi:hypothetical protein
MISRPWSDSTKDIRMNSERIEIPELYLIEGSEQ